MIGKKIKHARTAAGITQTELAKMVGISKQTLYKYETGIITNIPSDKVEAISNALHTTPAYLMGWEEPAPAADLTLTPTERSLIVGYRAADPGTQASVRKLLDVGEEMKESEAG